MNGSGIFANLQTWFLQPYTNFLATVGQQISTGLGPIVLALGTVAIMVMASRLLMGISSQPMPEFSKTTFKIAVIAALTLNFSNYMTFVATPLSDGIPNGVSNLFNPGTPLTGNSFDNSLKAIQTFVATVWSATPWRDTPMMALVLAVVVVAGVVLLVGAFILTIMTKAFLFFILTLGPIFIALLMFEATRGFFSQFINTAATLVIQQVLISATASIILTNLQTSVNDTSIPLLAGFNAIAFCFFSVFLVKEIPALARSLGSGGHAFAVGKLLPALRSAPDHMTAGAGWSGSRGSASQTGSAGPDGQGQPPSGKRRVGERRRTETAASGGLGNSGARAEMTPAAAIVAAASGWAGESATVSPMSASAGRADDVGGASADGNGSGTQTHGTTSRPDSGWSPGSNAGSNNAGWVSGGGAFELAGSARPIAGTAPNAGVVQGRHATGRSSVATPVISGATTSPSVAPGNARVVAGRTHQSGVTTADGPATEQPSSEFVGSSSRTEPLWAEIDDDADPDQSAP